jgi:hypothetical protein
MARIAVGSPDAADRAICGGVELLLAKDSYSRVKPIPDRYVSMQPDFPQ